MSLSAPLEIGSALVVSAVAARTVASAALRPQPQWFGKTLIAGSDPRQVALTFDDGPNDRYTLELLELLARHQVKATFFLVGQHVAARPNIVRSIQADGHLIANHTYTHPWLLLKPERIILEELERCSRTLEDVLGEPIRYFRPPHGARRPAVMRIARSLGMTTVQWNCMGMDWEPIGAGSIVHHIDRDLAKAARRSCSANILLHDGDGLRMGAERASSIAATAALLTRFAAEGRRFVTVDAWG